MKLPAASWSVRIELNVARIVLVALLAASAGAALAQVQAARGSATVAVEGSVDRQLSLGVDDLKRYPTRDVQITIDANRAGTPTASPRSYKGALLRDVMTAAKLREPKPRDLRRGYVIVSATDGYQVVFSWAELFLSPIGNSVIVAYERDGQPIADPEGPIVVVSGMDTGAARHVKWLQSIKFVIAGE